MPRSIRSTSIKAYHRILESGELAKSLDKVLRHLVYVHPDTVTGREADAQLHTVDAHKRLSDLKRMRLVEELGERECNVTGNPSSIEWGLCDNPILVPLVRGPSKKRIKKEEIVVSHCSECLFRDTDDTCMGVDDGEVKCTMPDGRPCDCPLFGKTYVIRGS
jgi:hypothetical protein